jgi:hypothetical protein
MTTSAFHHHTSFFYLRILIYLKSKNQERQDVALGLGGGEIIELMGQ